jgi:hypothetical protein
LDGWGNVDRVTNPKNGKPMGGAQRVLNGLCRGPGFLAFRKKRKIERKKEREKERFIFSTAAIHKLSILKIILYATNLNNN